MSAEEKKAILRQYFEEVCNKGNWAFDAEHIGAGRVMHRSDHGIETPPDLWAQGHTTLEGEMAEGDLVMSRTRFEGRFTGEWTLPWGSFTLVDKPIAFTWISINRFENGKIVETWIEGDFLGIAMQVGAIPTPAQAAA